MTFVVAFTRRATLPVQPIGETNTVLRTVIAALTQTNDIAGPTMASFLAAKMDPASREAIASILVKRLEDPAHSKVRLDAAVELRNLHVQSEPTRPLSCGEPRIATWM
jgi:hypothetical protein